VRQTGNKPSSAWRERITSSWQDETTGLLADEQVPTFGEDFKFDNKSKELKTTLFLHGHSFEEESGNIENERLH
jgi:hypothetical protein